jgi:hypothetical protein
LSCIAPLLFSLLCACTAPADDKQADDTGQPADTGAALEAWAEFYWVEGHIEAGGFAFDESYWARRDVDPGAGTITEVFVATADGTTTLTNILVDAEAGTFTLDINGGEYTGEGALVGEAWAWSSWSSRSVAADGSYVLSEDEMSGGDIHAEKEGFSVDDAPEWTLVEDLSAVSEAEHAAGLAELGR